MASSQDDYYDNVELPSRKKYMDQHPLASPATTWKFLEQTKVWVNAQNQVIRIKSMEASYLFATMNWLLRRAEEVKFALEMYYATIPGPQGEQAQADFDSSFAQFMTEDARKWMRQTPLFQRLERRYKKLIKPETIKIPVLLEIRDA